MPYSESAIGIFKLYPITIFFNNCLQQTQIKIIKFTYLKPLFLITLDLNEFFWFFETSSRIDPQTLIFT